MSNEQKNFKQNKAADGIDVEFSRELADHDDLEANTRANAADARQKRQSIEK
ncbi:YfhD family protein [Bacillus wiedmannii]|uniref:YfhD family protein n=1 Tax=Bacillus wiedmannii TaxID=1890302 RepID=UPI0011558A0B|nr:YfhD family protein [Bacillus wiedmannii]